MAFVAETNKIVVAGSSGTGKKYLLNRILKSTLEWQPTELKGVESCTWKVDTKYYTAYLEFWLVDTDKLNVLDDTVGEALGEVCQGVLLVYDSNKAKSWEAVQPWEVFAEKFRPDVMLCVGNQVSKDTDTKLRDKLEEQAREFASDHQMEFIAVPYDDGPVSGTEKPSETGDKGPRRLLGDEDEKIGTERIIEALQCNMWASLDLKPQNNNRMGGGLLSALSGGARQEAKAAPRSDDYEEEEEEEEEEEAEKESPSQEAATGSQANKENGNGVDKAAGLFNGLNLANGSTVASSAAASSSASSSSSSSPSLTSSSSSSSSSSSAAATAAATTATVANADSDASESFEFNSDEMLIKALGDVDNLEGLVEKVRSVRQAAATGMLSDDERRQRATDTLMALMNAFPLESESESDTET